MKKNDENIVVFKPHGGESKNFEENAEILNMNNVWVLRNANLFSPQTMSCKKVDILVVDNLIDTIAHHIEKVPPRCEEIDLGGDYVLPFFVNGYENIERGVEETYGATGLKKEDLEFLSFVKTSSAGAFTLFNVADDGFCFLENIAEKSEAELSEICDSAAKKHQTIFMRVGQDLDELGQIDKIYHKPLSQVLEDFGFLDRNCVIVGGNCFDKDDFELFAQYDVTVVVCPLEDAMFGRRPLNLAMLKNLGINVILGSGHSEQIDFFEYMRQVIAMQRCMFEDEEVLTEREIMKMAIGGDPKKLSNLFRIRTKYFLGVKEGSLANFLVVRNDFNFFGDDVKNLVWEKRKNDIMLTVFFGEVVQICSIVRGFDDLEEQENALHHIERSMKRLRRRKKNNEENV